MKDFVKHMNNIHPCLVEYLEDFEKRMIASSNKKFFDISIGDMSLSDIQITKMNTKLTTEIMDKLFNSYVILVSLNDDYYLTGETYIKRGATMFYLSYRGLDEDSKPVAYFETVDGTYALTVLYSSSQKFYIEKV